MIITVDELRHQVGKGMELLVRSLKEITGRDTPEEEKAWMASLPQVSRLLSHDSLKHLHLYFGGRGKLSLEYPLPSSASWCDVVLLGRHRDRNSAVVIELKNWTTTGDRPGTVEGLIERREGVHLHPSEQVRGYTEYCRRFHSTVQTFNADVHGCAFFTLEGPGAAYTEEPNTNLTRHFPVFSLAKEDVEERIPRYFAERLTEADEYFAAQWESGYYRQDRSFVRGLAQQISDPSKSPFVLLDSQRLAFAKCRAALEHALFKSEQPRKTALIIQGPPGSGKSVIAAQLWAWLAQDERLRPGSLVVTTTSASQRSNWEHAFKKLHRAASGVVMPANRYAPVSTHEMGKAMKAVPEHRWAAENWSANIEQLRNWRGNLRVPDNQFMVSIVDEAHALINPESPKARAPAGWPVPCGPQAYHILKASVVTVFLMDGEQGFRDRENTTVADISLWASGLGASVADTVFLEDSQYRCAGSKDYVDWLDSELGLTDRPKPSTRLWRKKGLGGLLDADTAATAQMAAEGEQTKEGPFIFEILDNPFQLEAALRGHLSEGKSARLLASFAKPWKSKGEPRPHSLPQADMDFFYTVPTLAGDRTWARVWNFVPPHDEGNYTWFVQAAPGSPMSGDPLCEVGCPYAVRGFDYDYVGLLWQNDLVWRIDRWRVLPENVTETGNKTTKSEAMKAASVADPKVELLQTKVAQAYRILLTRAIKGIYVWCEDDETRRHLLQMIALR